jgi:hypothetical protein
MYFSRQQPPEGGARALRALHVSLNAPVVAIEDLPVGPARAAIALQDAPDGGASLLLALRSQRTGQLACFAPDEPLTETTAQIALDGALSFAESMGFLFDGDVIPELGAEGPREAAESWNQLLGVAPEPEPEPGRAARREPGGDLVGGGGGPARAGCAGRRRAADRGGLGAGDRPGAARGAAAHQVSPHHRCFGPQRMADPSAQQLLILAREGTWLRFPSTRSGC